MFNCTSLRSIRNYTIIAGKQSANQIVATMVLHLNSFAKQSSLLTYLFIIYLLNI